MNISLKTSERNNLTRLINNLLEQTSLAAKESTTSRGLKFL